MGRGGFPITSRLRVASGLLSHAAPNNGMHPTADTPDFKYLDLAGRRVMPGVRLLGLIKSLAETRGRQWRAALSRAGIPLSPGAALRIIRHGARREVRAPRMVGARDV